MSKACDCHYLNTIPYQDVLPVLMTDIGPCSPMAKSMFFPNFKENIPKSSNIYSHESYTFLVGVQSLPFLTPKLWKYTCIQCHKSFAKRRDLKEHINSVHVKSFFVSFTDLV